MEKKESDWFIQEVKIENSQAPAVLKSARKKKVGIMGTALLYSNNCPTCHIVIDVPIIFEFNNKSLHTKTDFEPRRFVIIVYLFK